MPTPPLPPDARSILLAVDTTPLPLDGTGAPAWYAYAAPSLAGRAQVLEVPEVPTGELYALTYAIDLERLGLPPGPVPTVASDAPSRGLPSPNTTQALSLGDASWKVVPLPERLAGRRLPAVDPLPCWAQGGCALIDGTCQRPCPRPEAPQPPTPPEPPRPTAIERLTCPTRSSTVGLFGAPLSVCRDDPSTLTCPTGSARPPDGTTCLPLGKACAGWPNDLPPGPAIYVDDDAGPGGEGSRARPYNDLSSALQAPPPGAVIVLAPGEYVGPVELPPNVSLIGSCVAGTRIVSALHGVVIAGNAVVRELQIAAQPALSAGLGSHLEAQDLALEGMLELDGGTARVERMIARGVRGTALQVTGHATVTIEGAYIESASGAGLVCNRAQLNLRDLVIRGGANPPGPGISAVSGGVVVVERALLEGLSTGAQIEASELTATDLLVRDTFGPTVGPGVFAIDGSTVSVSRVRGQALGGQALLVLGSAAQVEDLDVDSTLQVAVVAMGSSRIGLRRARISGVDPGAIEIGQGAVIELEDLEVTQSLRPEPSQEILVEGALVLRRGLLRDGLGHGLLSSGAGVMLELNDLEIRGMEASGVYLNGELDELTAERLWIRDLTQAALFTPAGVTARIQDLTVENIERGVGNRLGALTLVESSILEIERFVVRGSQVGIDVEPTVEGVHDQHLRQGLVSDNRAGLLVRGEQVRLPEILEQVVFEGNERISLTSE